MNLFKKWALGFSGCDGGDIGSPNNQSAWICGIEWGGGFSPTDTEHLERIFAIPVNTASCGYDDWTENIAYIYNWQAMKLLGVINGFAVNKYKKFAEQVKPFVQNEVGYFKMNLYPIAFKNTSHAL